MVSHAVIAPKTNKIALLLAFFVIYVVWGSTYLAIRYAVESIPPLLVVGVRQGLAGLAIFAWVYTHGYRPTLREWRASVMLGILYFVISHGLLHWAETIVPSGIAALLIATEPLWIATMAAVISREERFTAKTAFGLVLGLAGVALLMREEAGLGNGRMLLGCAAVLISSFTWACGVIYTRNPNLPKDPIARAGMAALTASVLLLLGSALSGEMTHAHLSAFSARSIWALLYLIVFGTIIAFTTYTWLLDHCSPTLVSTHTYANPIIAVLLGWSLAGERLDIRVLFAGLLTLLSVFLISRGTGERPELRAQVDEAA
ncbi:MAG: EamA family transporter [Candidatus Korobacteraceae bacterium]